jgi:methyl-accepting chemotaxis protein
VATEVRALAQRSADAAKEIKALISASGLQVEGGVKLVAETGRSLVQIGQDVTKMSDLVAGIAASAREQAVGLEQVNTAVNQMDQVTQQNAAMVEESTAACHSLAAEAEAMAGLVDRFRLDAPEAAAAQPLRRAMRTGEKIAAD